MKQAKVKFWKKYKIIFGFILFVIGILAFSSLTGDALSGIAIATVPTLVWIKDGQFTHELTDEEFKALETKDQAIYIKEFNQFRVEKAAHELNEKIKELVSKDQFDDLQKKLDKLTDLKEKELELAIKEVEEIAANISKALTEANKQKGRKNLSKLELKLVDIDAQVKEGDKFVTKNIKEVTDSHVEGKKFKFVVKGTFIGSDDVTTLDHHIGSQRVPGIGQYAGPRLVLSEFFGMNVSPIQIDGNGVAVYEDWDEASSTKNAAFIAEGATFPESEAKFKSYSISIEKIGDSMSMTYEAVRDFNRFTRELSRFLTRNIQSVVNQALWNGTGVTPQFAGIYTRVDAFNAAGYTGPTTTTPDLLDLVKVLAKEIMDGKDDKYAPDFVFVDWDEYLELALEKDTTGRLIYPNGVPSVMGITIYPTSFVTTNTLVIGDKRYVECIGDPNAITIEMGYKSGDWEADKESMKGRVRTCLLIREADKDGFLKVTDVDAAILAITT
jgi:hypothetical protein